MTTIRSRVIILPEDLEGEDMLIDLANVGGQHEVYRDTIANIAYLRTLETVSGRIIVTTVGNTIQFDFDDAGLGGGDFSTSVSSVTDQALVSFDGTTGKLGAEAPLRWDENTGTPGEEKYWLEVQHATAGFIEALRSDRGNLGAGTVNYLHVGNSFDTHTIIQTLDSTHGPWVGSTLSPMMHQFRAEGWEMDNGGYISDIHITSQAIALVKTVSFIEEVDNGLTGTAETINWNAGQKQTSLIDDDVTFTFTDLTEGEAANFILRTEYSSATARTAIWPSNVRWRAGVAPTLSSDANLVDVFTFYWNGSHYYGTAALGFVIPA